ncbi:MAG: hypothetical protein R2736_18970 [Solirubrobacterales bacterium]
MRKTLLALTGAAALCIPAGAAVAAGPPDHASGHQGPQKADVQTPAKKAPQSAAQTCKAQRAQLGQDAFRQLYGTNKNKRNAFGRCVDQTKGTTAQQREDVLNAAMACRAEREAGPEAFAQKYGTNANKRNAFGKCVSAKAKTKS